MHGTPDLVGVLGAPVGWGPVFLPFTLFSNHHNCKHNGCCYANYVRPLPHNPAISWYKCNDFSLLTFPLNTTLILMTFLLYFKPLIISSIALAQAYRDLMRD